MELIKEDGGNFLYLYLKDKNDNIVAEAELLKSFKHKFIKEKTIYLAYLKVPLKYRRLGYATFLLKHILEIYDDNIVILKAHSELTDKYNPISNQVLSNFYKAFGFENIDIEIYTNFMLKGNCTYTDSYYKYLTLEGLT